MRYLKQNHTGSASFSTAVEPQELIFCLYKRDAWPLGTGSFKVMIKIIANNQKFSSSIHHPSMLKFTGILSGQTTSFRENRSRPQDSPVTLQASTSIAASAESKCRGAGSSLIRSKG